MKRRTVAVAAMLISQAACGDLKRTWDEAQAETDAKQARDATQLTADLMIDNQWAEAQFKVTDSTFGDSIVPAQRIAAFSSQRFAGAVRGHPDDGAKLTVETTAAQTIRVFRLDEPVQQGRTLHLVFDYDSVQLVFSLSPHWEDE